MCETQRQLIKTFTQESLDQCTEIMKENFEKIKKDMLDKLVDGVRLDIFDKINGSVTNDTEYKIYSSEDIEKEIIEKFPIRLSNYQRADENLEVQINNARTQVIDKWKNSQVLKKDEHYVHFINHYQWVFTTLPWLSHNPSNNNMDIIMILGTVTNFSNFTWIEARCKLYEYTQVQNEIVIKSKNYEPNIPLHSMYIDILSTIKSLSPQSLSGHDELKTRYDGYENKYARVMNIHGESKSNNGFPPSHSNRGRHTMGDEVFNNDKNVKFYTELYEIIVKLLDMNKKYSMNMLVELDLQKKYEKLLKDKAMVDVTNKSLEDKIKKLENQLKESVPVEHQCCICFGYTDKNMICVPCDHAQYCDECINKLSNCAICRENVMTVVKTFR